MTVLYTIAEARSVGDLADARALFVEYTASLGVDLGYQDIEAELAGLPGKYAPPGGVILIAREADGRAVGCAALRPLGEPGDCEIKRLYVRPAARGAALGRRLAEAVIAHARSLDHRRMLLDTLPDMQAAQGLYRDLGFRPVAPYYRSPVEGTVFMELKL